MKRKLFAILIALMWLALPLTALRYAQVWDQLPARMATHFGANGQPNGWMPRATSLYFGLGLTAFVLIIFTIITVILLKQKAQPDTASFALLGFFYFMTGSTFYVNNGFILKPYGKSHHGGAVHAGGASRNCPVRSDLHARPAR